MHGSEGTRRCAVVCSGSKKSVFKDRRSSSTISSSTERGVSGVWCLYPDSIRVSRSDNIVNWSWMFFIPLSNWESVSESSWLIRFDFFFWGWLSTSDRDEDRCRLCEDLWESDITLKNSKKREEKTSNLPVWAHTKKKPLELTWPACLWAGSTSSRYFYFCYCTGSVLTLTLF